MPPFLSIRKLEVIDMVLPFKFFKLGQVLSRLVLINAISFLMVSGEIEII